MNVGIAELRQNLSVYLKRVADGERLIVTDHNKPVAELGPLRSGVAEIDRMVAEGLLLPPTRAWDPRPLPLPSHIDDPRAASRALQQLRDEETR